MNARHFASFVASGRPLVVSGFSRTFPIALVLLAAHRAIAQEPTAPKAAPERRITTDPASVKAAGPWSLTLAGYGGYDNSRFDTFNTATSAAERTSSAGAQPGFSARLNGTETRRDSTFSLTAGTNAGYYPLADRVLTDVNVAAGQSTKLARRTTIGAAETFSYAPYYSFGIAAGLPAFGGAGLPTAAPPSVDYATKATNVSRYGVSGQVSQALTERTDLSASYSAQFSRFEAGAGDGTYQTIGARVSHHSTNAVGVHAGYSMTDAGYTGVTRASRFHNIEAGTDLTKASSPTRRTTFSLSAGSGIADSQGGSTRGEFRFTGRAGLDHYFARTWSARAGYSREWTQFEGAVDPYFRDSASASVGGMVNRRTSATFNAMYLLGNFAGSASLRRDRAYSGSAWLGTAMSRTVSLFAQYVYFHQELQDQRTGLDLPRQFERNSVRAGLVVLLPRAR